MSKWTDSEISLLVKQLERSHDFYDKHKAILLADRNYPGVELFSIIEHYDMKYCIRGKTNFFKKYLFIKMCRLNFYRQKGRYRYGYLVNYFFGI